MSIKEKLEKIKREVDFSGKMERNSFVAVLLVLIALISFGFGRLSGLQTVKGEVEIEFPVGQEASSFLGTFEDSSKPVPAKTSGIYVASKSGTKYYLPSCGSSKRISEKNKIWFDTKEEAEASGYDPASNCPGL